MKSTNRFKEWVILMTKNAYLPLFLIFFGILISQLFRIEDVIYNIKNNPYIWLSIIANLMPITICLILAYKMDEFWDDYINGRTR